jgi:predicted MPP superfamily phosphohydrolase
VSWGRPSCLPRLQADRKICPTLESEHSRYADLCLEIPPGPPFWIRAQAPLLGQLVDNLLDNACKYSDEGTTVHLCLAREPGSVLLTIADHGCGIAPEDLPHLFEPFYRSPQARRQGQAGVGLGLAVARRMAEALAGTLTVQSEPGKGSRFLLRFPAADPAGPPSDGSPCKNTGLAVRASWHAQSLSEGRGAPAATACGAWIPAGAPRPSLRLRACHAIALHWWTSVLALVRTGASRPADLTAAPVTFRIHYMIFFLIIFGLPVLHVLWWWSIHRHLDTLRRARWWQGALAVLAGGLLAGYLWLMGTRMAGQRPFMPMPLLVLLYVWYLVVLPLTALAMGLAAWLARLRIVGRTLLGSRPVVQDGPVPPVGLTRRQVLAASLAVTPPVLAAGGVFRALTYLEDFRIRRFDVILPALPPSLDGMTITNVSDVHVGRFTHGATLTRIADAANALRADLIVLTGDLIDSRLSDLPSGLDLVKRLDAPGGVWMCEGNHDLFESRSEFERRVRAAGVPLLLNEAETTRIRGQEIQLLGVSWGGADRPDANVAANVCAAAALRKPEAFAILLAHHPHAFDAAVEADIPLTLAGHTHGGQLMVSERLGAGPVLYRYWSGLYQHGANALVVSNGVGNWFPLRLHAPAEIVHLTLRRA